MHQAPNATPHTSTEPTNGYFASWGHAVSKALIHWRRLSNALDPDRHSSCDYHDGDCDGTVTLADGHNLGTIMTFGPDCARPVGSSNDAPRVAIARPTDPSGPDMTKWPRVKDLSNPIQFASSPQPRRKKAGMANGPAGRRRREVRAHPCPLGYFRTSRELVFSGGHRGPAFVRAKGKPGRHSVSRFESPSMLHISILRSLRRCLGRLVISR